MKASDIIEMIKFNFNTPAAVPTPVYIEGRPGQGKTSIVYEAAEELDVPVIEFRPCNHGIEDLIGLPAFNEDKTKSWFAKPSWLPNAERDGERGIFFIDEFVQATPAMQNALSQLLNGNPRRIHDYIFPEKWLIVAAGNRAKDRAATQKMPTHIADRLSPRVTMEFSLDDWVQWATGKLNPALIAFAKWRGESLFEKFDPTLEINCTPRSLAMCDPYINAPQNLIPSMVYGTIGEGAGAEFVGFLKIWKGLPDLDYAMKNPDKVTIPSEPDVLFALTQAMSFKCDEQNADHLAKLTSRLPEEYQVMFFKDVLTRTRAVAKSQAFRDFLKDNKEMIL